MRHTLLPAREFQAAAADWDRLAVQSGMPPFLRAAFIAPALQHFGDGREQLLQLHDDQGLLAAAVLTRGAHFGTWETFQPSQLPLGALVARPRTDLAMLAEAIAGALPGLCLRLGLTQLDPLFLARPADAPRLRTVDYIATAWIDITQPFDAFWNARGKNLRQNTRKQRNKLDAEATTTALDCLTDPADVAQALVDYGQLENSGWKAGTGTAVHPDNAQGRFYADMLRAFCASGHGRIYRYRFGDKVVAMDLCIDDGRTITILKTSYDERYKTISPSTLMRHDEFQQLFDERRFGRIEFYGKVMEWHTRWTEQQRTLFHANADRWSWLQGLRQKLARPAASATPAAPASADSGAAAP